MIVLGRVSIAGKMLAFTVKSGHFEVSLEMGKGSSINDVTDFWMTSLLAWLRLLLLILICHKVLDPLLLRL